MNKKINLLLFCLFGLLWVGAAGFFAWYIGNHPIAVLQPAGMVADKQRNLIILATLLMLIVVLPVFALTFGIAWRYRSGNTRAKYSPDWDGNRWLEVTWWLIPTIIIGILAGVAWQSSRDLDPFRPLDVNAPPLKIQVVATQWKWLFIYPEQHIATTNFLEVPAGRPVALDITSDGPMNSFWVPQLGGQIYAMSGMSTQLHLMADRTGDFRGSSANISGQGFASMDFTVRAVDQADFARWLQTVKQSPKQLTSVAYTELAKPSTLPAPQYYAQIDDGLYDMILMKYMMPMTNQEGQGGYAR